MSWGKRGRGGGTLHSYAPPQIAIVLTGCGVDRGDIVGRDARIMKMGNFHMMILLIHSFSSLMIRKEQSFSIRPVGVSPLVTEPYASLMCFDRV
jgi:hypothetical protein